MKYNDINVYVTNDFGYDLSDAKRYIKGDGEIIPITEGRVSIKYIEKLTNKMLYMISEMKEADYLLISGNSVVASLASAVVFNKFKKLNTVLVSMKKLCSSRRQII